MAVIFIKLARKNVVKEERKESKKRKKDEDDDDAPLSIRYSVFTSIKIEKKVQLLKNYGIFINFRNILLC